MKTNKKSFIMYHDLCEIFRELTDNEAGKLIKTICLEDYKPEPMIKLLFHPFKKALERDNEKYANIVERNRNNGKQGGRPNARNNPVGCLGTQDNPEKPKKADNDIDIENVIETETEEEENAPLSSASSKKDNIPYEKIRELFNSIVAHSTSTVPTCMEVTPSRKPKVKARWKKQLKTLEAWEKYFKRVAASDFLMQANFTDFGWLINAENCTKILEDKYSNFRNQK